MKIAVVQFKPTLGELEKNIEKTVFFGEKAVKEGAEVCVFPELSLTGYNLQDLTFEVAVKINSPKLEPLKELSKRIALIVGLIEETEEDLFYNSAICIFNGKILHLHRKIYLPTYGMFDEGRFVASGEKVKTFNLKGIKSTILICEDLWHLSTVYLSFVQGAKVIYSLSASPGRGYKQERVFENVKIWKTMGKLYSKLTGSYFIYANRVGVEDGFVFSGNSFVYDPFGNLIAEASPFKEEIITVELDPSLIRAARISLPLLRDEKVELTLNNLRRIVDEGETL